MKVTHRHGRVRLRLDEPEVELLTSLLGELEIVLDGRPGDEAVYGRLFPAAYAEDAEAEAEYRELTAGGLRDGRLERIDACQAELASAPDVDLTDEDAGRRWLQVLNDLRLALGTRIGVTEDEPPELDPTDPASMPWLIYHWLTLMQDTLVRALMG